MENIKIKRYFDKKNENTQMILINILEDSLLCLYNHELIEDVTLNRVIFFYFLLREYKYDKMIEFEEFSVEEKKIIFKMIMEGIASVYVDNEYLESSDRGTKYKQIIIGELLSFFRYITKCSKEKVFDLYVKEVQKYRKKGFTWDNIPY